MLRRNIVKSLFAAAVLAIGVNAAEAAIVDFDFTGATGTSIVGSKSYTVSGLTVTATAGQFDIIQGQTSQSIVDNGAPNVMTSVPVTTTTGLVTAPIGLGIAFNASSNANSVDSSGGLAGVFREALKFHFDQSVKLVSVTLVSYGGNATRTVAFFYESAGNLISRAGNNPYPGTDSFDMTGTVDVSAKNYTGDDFGVGAKGGAFFYVAGMSVEVEPIPVPAAGLLLGSIVLLPLLRRKRRG